MNVIFLFFGLILITLAGFLLVSLFITGAHILERLAVGYLVSMGLFTFLLFLFNLAGYKYGLFTSNLVLFILVLSVGLISYMKYRRIFLLDFRQTVREKTRHNLVFSFFLLLIVITLVSSFVSNMYWPVKDWDSLVLYDFRGVSFANTGFMHEAISTGNFVGYPLLTSISHMYVYIFGVVNPMFLYSLFLLCFVVCFYYRLKKFLTANVSMLFTLLLLLIPGIYEHSTMAYTNLPYTIYLVLSSIYLYYGLKNAELGSIVVSALLAGLSTWTRSTEPFWLVNFGAYVCVFSYYILRQIFLDKGTFLNRIKNVLKSGTLRKLLFGLLIFSALFFSIQIPWRHFSALLHYDLGLNPLIQVQSAFNGLADAQKSNTLPLVADYLYRFVFLPVWWLYVLVPLAFVYRILRKQNDYIYLLFVGGQIAMVAVGTYVFSVSYPGWEEIHGSLQRLSIFLSPMILFYVAGAFSIEERK